MRAFTAALAAGVALLLAGCGTPVSVIIPKGAETLIKNVVKQQTGQQVTDVSCPSNVRAKAGTTFTCHFSAGGQKYLAHMHIVRVKGAGVYYDVTTSPA
jgi:hypothetical protein